MELSLPILVDASKPPGQAPIYRTRLLFYPWIQAADSFLQHATHKLIQVIKKEYDGLGRDWNHQHLFSSAYNPDLDTHRLKLQLDLKSRIAKVKYLLVVINAWGRQVVFNPHLDTIWFEVMPDEDLKQKATDVYQKYFRNQLKEQDDQAEQPESFSISRESWVTSIDVDIRVDQVSMQESAKKMMALWAQEDVDGATELFRVGRCLDALYPNDLEFAIRREDEVKRLEQLLSNPDHRPVLVIGEPLVGKTAIIHQVVRHRVESRKEKNAREENVWLLAPQRLISGMSYVGQWENRFLAIVKEARKKKLILYFDDLLGLFLAGRTSQSSLSVADLLKNEILKSGLRVIGEMTPAAYDKLLDRDRGFADLFHAERIAATSDQETLQVAVQYTIEQEARQKCRFDFTAIPKIIQLQRQYNRQASFPGKAAKFVKELAVKNPSREINHQVVLNEFADANGIDVTMLDDDSILKRESVVENLSRSLIGQAEAIEACADVVGWTKAKLNDPAKPLATMLFLGPTGVGKTECAKTLARYLFRSDEKLLRFDLNEYKSAYSVARLIGTPDEPEGLLTSAVRQNPFSIVLLDEIEKAHPDVFDMLLQVTGEGRLSDSLGRTTDFTNCVLIMTSNLGASAHVSSLGFADQKSTPSDHRFVRAAQKFFRPEFFNRIDKIIPFEPLSRDQIGLIADQMMQRVVSREGLLRRRCILQVDHQALNQVATRGYHPTMGARALKRAIEKDFTQPVARQLSGIRNDLPTVIRVSGKGESEYELETIPLENVKVVNNRLSGIETSELLAGVKRFLARFEDELLAHRPEGEITGSGVSPELLRYLTLSDQVARLREATRDVEHQIKERASSMAPPEIKTPAPRWKRSRMYPGNFSSTLVSFLRDLNNAQDISAFVNESFQLQDEQQSDAVKLQNELNWRTSLESQLVRDCCVLESMERSHERPFYFFYRFFSQSGPTGILNQLRHRLFDAYMDFFENSLGLETLFRPIWFSENESGMLFRLSGACVSELVKQEMGAQLFCHEDGKLSLIQTGCFEHSTALDHELDEAGFDYNHDLAEPKTLQGHQCPRLVERLDEVASYEVIRMYDYQHRTIDLRSGTVDQKLLTGELLHQMMAAGLPLPAELSELISEMALPGEA